MAIDADFRDQVDLAGMWQIAFDPTGQGIGDGWMAGEWPEDRSQTVHVPSIWERDYPNAEGIAFYRKIVDVPADWGQRALRLRFGGASYATAAWLNGCYLGSHEGAYTPFAFDATQPARVGDANELVVRVAGLSKQRAIDGMRLEQTPASKQSWFYTCSGLWGDVVVEAVPQLSCDDVMIQPDARNEAAIVEVVARNCSEFARSVELTLDVRSPTGNPVGGQRDRVTVPPGIARFVYRLALPRPERWSCDNPALYQLTVAFTERGEAVDRRIVTFGMRDFGVRDGQFLLNDEPIFVRGALLQPNYPVGLIAPPTRKMMEREIRLMKAAGFNLIRTHIRPAPPGYLDLTDELGMLVYAESSLAWIKESPRLLDHAAREVRALIERDRNHPSVVIWGIHNENRAASAATSDALVRLARSLDETRVVVDNSGGTMAIDQDYGWSDRTTVLDAWRTERERIQDLHIYVGAPVPHGVSEWLRTLGQCPSPVDIRAYGFGSPAMLADWRRDLQTYRGKIFVSELGCGGMTDLDDVVAAYGDQTHLRDAQEMRAFRDSLHEGFAARRLDRIFGSVQNLVAAAQEAQARGNSRQVEALLVNPRVSGFIVTQINDVAWEFHAGLLDPWRNPKRTYDAFKRLNQPNCLVLHAPDAVVATGDRVDVALTLVQHASSDEADRVQIAVFDSERQPILQVSRRMPPGAGIKELGAISFAADGPGEYRIEARLLEGETESSGTIETVLALPLPDWTGILDDFSFVGTPPVVAGSGRPQDLCRLESAAPGEASRVVAAKPGSLSRDEWNALFAAVAAGGGGVIGPLRPEDDLARSMLAERGVPVALHFGIGNWMGCYHWTPASEVFDGLPAGGLAGEAYADVLPHYVLSEIGGEVLAGSFRNTQTRREAPVMLWYSDIEAIPFGEGTLIFCQYRLFDRADRNPLAGRLLCNLLRLGGSLVAPDATSRLG